MPDQMILGGAIKDRPGRSGQEEKPVVHKRQSKNEIAWSSEAVVSFFGRSNWLDEFVLRPLSHIASCWELRRTGTIGVFMEEEESLAGLMNTLIGDISMATPPADYHGHEDAVIRLRNGPENSSIYLEGKRWRDRRTGEPLGKSAIGGLLEQAAIGYDDVPDLILAAAGRVAVALKFGQANFDDLDDGHSDMLSEVLTVILFIRANATWLPEQAEREAALEAGLPTQF